MLLEQLDNDTGSFLIFRLRHRSLCPDNHCHQSQDPDQDQWTECDSGHRVLFLI